MLICNSICLLLFLCIGIELDLHNFVIRLTLLIVELYGLVLCYNNGYFNDMHLFMFIYTVADKFTSTDTHLYFGCRHKHADFLHVQQLGVYYECGIKLLLYIYFGEIYGESH